MFPNLAKISRFYELQISEELNGQKQYFQNRFLLYQNIFIFFKNKVCKTDSYSAIQIYKKKENMTKIDFFLKMEIHTLKSQYFKIFTCTYPENESCVKKS